MSSADIRYLGSGNFYFKGKGQNNVHEGASLPSRQTDTAPGCMSGVLHTANSSQPAALQEMCSHIISLLDHPAFVTCSLVR